MPAVARNRNLNYVFAAVIVVALAIDWFPIQASRESEKIDTLWDVLLIASVPVVCPSRNTSPGSRSTTIVDSGPYRFTRNPIYLGMVLGLIGLAIAFNSLWLLLTLVPFALVIRYGVVAREEAYLERKFGDVYRRYRARVRRWL